MHHSGMRRIALAFLMAAGCGGPDGPEPTPPSACAAPVGQYRVTYRRTEGTCPEPWATVVDADAPAGPADPECSESAGPVGEPDECKGKFERVCVRSALTITTRGTVQWARDAASAMGTVYTESRGTSSGSILCTGVYAVTYEQL